MFKKIFVSLLAASMMFSMVSCTTPAETESSTDETTESSATESSEATEEGEATEGAQSLSVACWDPAFNMYAMEEAAKVYQETNPDFTLDIQEVPWEDLQARLITAASSGDSSILTDIFLLQNNAYQKNVSNYPDLFTDLTGSAVNFDEFNQGVLAYSTYDGKNYGVPFDNGAVIMALRTDLLANAGQTVEDYTDITWSEYIALGEAYVAANNMPLLSGTNDGADILIMMIKSAGVSFFDDEGNAYIEGNPELAAAAEIYKQLVEKGIMQQYSSWDEYVAGFVNGNAGGVMNGCWILGSIQTAADQSGNWAVTNVPKLEGFDSATNYTENGGSSWAVSGASENKDLAIDFLASTFGGSVEFYDTILGQSGALAHWQPAAASDVYQEPSEFFGGQPIYADISAFAGEVLPFNTGVYYYEGQTALNVASQSIVTGTPIEDALKTAQEELEFNMG